MKKKPTPRVVDPDFARSIADGLTESYEAYCRRLDASTEPPEESADEQS